MKKMLSPLLIAFIGCLAAGMLMTPEAKAAGCSEMNLQRLAAEFNYFDTGHAESSDPPPGVAVYQKMVFVPDGCDTLYVIMSGTGDAHVGAAHWFSCKLDSAFCRPELSPATDTPGWIALQRHGEFDDFHENGIHYTWCTAVKPGIHAVEIRMARDLWSDGGTVYFSGSHFYVDASYTGGGCVVAQPTEDPLSSLAAGAAARSSESTRSLIFHRPGVSTTPAPLPLPPALPAPPEVPLLPLR